MANKGYQLKTGYIESSLITDYSTQQSFYSSCELMSDITNINDINSTYKITEDDHHLLLSNGLWYDKDRDILFTNNFASRGQYARLLLGYPHDIMFLYEYYSEFAYPTQFGVYSTNDDYIGIIRNTSIGCRGILGGNGLEQIDQRSDFEALKLLVIQKNAETYVDTKTETVFLHELFQSVKNLSISTPFSMANLQSRFISSMTDVMTKFGYDLSTVAKLASSYLFQVYAMDMTISPLYLNVMNTTFTVPYRLSAFTLVKDSSYIMETGWLAFEYIYNHQFTDQSSSIDVANLYIKETFDTTVDLLKYILPPIKAINFANLYSNNRKFGCCAKSDILNLKTVFDLSSIFQSSFHDGTIDLYYIYQTVSYTLSYNLTTIKNEFFSIFPDLSTTAISDLIDSITSFDKIFTQNTRPYILLFDDANYTTYSASGNLSKVFLFSLFFSEILRGIDQTTTYVDSSDNTYTVSTLNSMGTNISLSDASSYINSASKESLYAYATKLFTGYNNIYPMTTNVFDTNFYDDLNANMVAISTIGTDTLCQLTTYNGSDLSIAIDDNVLDVDVDDTSVYFMSSTIDDVIESVYRCEDIENIQYRNSAPYNLYTIEHNISSPSVNDILLSFTNDDTRLQHVPVNLNVNNIMTIPYKGLILLNDVIDGDNLNLINLQIQRDISTNSWALKVELDKYDGLSVDRNIIFSLYGDKTISFYQEIKYEFGLGFELISSENIDNIEMLKLLYIILDNEHQENNIAVEKLSQDISKFKLVFRKLTDQNFTLRTVVAYQNEEEIISTVNNTI